MGVTSSKPPVASPPPDPAKTTDERLKRTREQRDAEDSSSSSSLSEYHVRPLNRFRDLAFACQFVFRDEQTRERSLDPDFFVPLFVDGWDVTSTKEEEEEEEYCLSGNVPLDPLYLHSHALSTAYNLDCHISCRSGEDGIALCAAMALLQGDELAAGLPFGERTRHSASDTQWRFTIPMGHHGFGSRECVYSSLVLTVVPIGVSFYISRVELRLPRQFCELWFARNCLVQRQVVAGITQ